MNEAPAGWRRRLLVLLIIIGYVLVGVIIAWMWPQESCAVLTHCR